MINAGGWKVPKQGMPPTKKEEQSAGIATQQAETCRGMPGKRQEV